MLDDVERLPEMKGGSMISDDAADVSPRSAYWEKRKASLYYQVVYQFVSVVGDAAQSILDVGSAGTEYINWFDWIPNRTQLNRGFGNAAAPEGIERITADFFDWEPPHRYDVVLCMQVLEHIVEAEKFCDRLKKAGRRLVISVPYKWRAGAHENHVNDPVDREKLRGWMGRRPNHSKVVNEPFGPSRYVCYYDLDAGEEEKIPKSIARPLILKRAR